MPILPPIRTITLGIAEPHPIPAPVIERAKTTLQHARVRYSEAGYEVQSVRLSTQPIFTNLTGWSVSAILAYVKELQSLLDAAGLEYCSLGPAQAAQPGFPLDRLQLIVDMLARTRAFSATVQLATVEHGLRQEAAMPTAHIIQRLAQETPSGDGNFRFAMLACVAPGCPFFPAAYHAGPGSLSIGLQGASIIREALLGHEAEMTIGLDMRLVTQWVSDSLNEQATPIVALGQPLAQEHGLLFGGIDLSPAPMGEDSIVPALELCAGGPLGTPGTVAAVAAVTAALKSTTLPTCGYCGLMLPVLEDAMLGQRWEEDYVNVHQLLFYSSVCGTGLDTIPLAGSHSVGEIAHLLLDVATLSLRLQKPLSARLFPIVGRQTGERTTFTSPYLTNTRIK
ncbi:MAG TPA: DUF711 family protein [Ktedonobacteraceae bacterium]|jgi:hypothetical protein